MSLNSTLMSTRGTGLRAALLAGMVLAVILSGPFYARALDPAALPTGGQIIAGQGQIDTSGSAMTVTQTSDRMVADWNTFNIGSGAAVTFAQPSAGSVALNRIYDTAPSQIFGRLSANGQVFLLNPAGILFGATAQVDVGGLVASSLGLSNDAFMAGNFTFDGSSAAGSILNQGTIQAPEGGYVAFLAPHVENQGEISASGGTVAMAAGDRVSLDFSGDRLVNFIVDRGSVDALVENSGTIRADGGAVLLSAKAADALTRSVVNNTGVIEAKSLENRNGRIVLRSDMDTGEVNITGSMDVSGSETGATGGQVTATGATVTLTDGATIDASGSAGGGEIYIGGGYQGGDPDIGNATETVVDPGTVLDASAVDDGDGGTVVVWSDGNTFFNGSILARGGDARGDGGRVEVSGKENLGFWGSADVLSPNGVNGSLLLDPSTLTILNGSSGQTGTYADWSNHDLSGSYNIPETVLESLTGNVVLTAVSNIIINDLTDNVLNLSADSISFFSNDESFQSSSGGFYMDTSDTIRLNGSGNLTLQGGNTYVSSAGGNYSIYAGNLQTNGGNVIFNTKRSSAASPIRVAGTITTNGGSVSVAAGTRFGLTNSENVNVQIDGLVSTSGGNFASNMIGTVKINGGMNLGAGTASFGGTGTQINSVITSTSDVTIAAPLTFGAGSGITTTGTVTFNQAAAMGSTGADVTLTASNFVFNNTFTGNSGTITLKPYNSSTNVDIGAAGSGNMTITNSIFSQLSGFSNVTVGRADGTGTTKVLGNTTVAAGGYLELANKTVDITTGTLANTGGDIILTGDSFAVTKSVTAKGGTGKVSLRQLTAGTPITLGSGLTNSVLDKISAGTLEVGRIDGGNVTFDGNITTSTNALNVLSGGNITLGSGVTLNVGTGTATLAAVGHFINNAGSSPITTSGAGRWLIYSAGPAGDTFGGLASGNNALWHKTYAGYPPASVSETGNRYLFSTQPALTFTAANKTKTYGQAVDLSSPAAGTDYTVSGLINAATYGNVFTQDSYSGAPALASTGAAATASVAGSSYAITIAANTLTNPAGYGAATFTNGGLTVNKAALTVTAANDSKTYNGSAYSGGNGATYSGFVNSETAIVLGGTLAYGGTSQGAKNAGTYAITPSGLTSGNYALSFANGVLTINKKALTAAYTASNKVYDATTSATVSGSSSDIIAGDTVTFGQSAVFTDKNVGDGKTVNVSSISLGGASASNYNLQNTTAATTANITPKDLTAAYTGVNKVYDATTTAAATGASGDIIAGDTVTFAQSAAFTDKNAGTGKTINVSSISLSGTDAGNYNLQNTTAATTANITPKDLTAAYTGVNKVYDATTTAAATGASGDIIAGDTVTFAQSAAFADKNAGTGKTINVSSISLSGTDAGNYNLQNTTAATTANITPKDLTAAYTGVNKVYDATTTAAATGASGDIIAGDTVTFAQNAAFVDKNVGTGKTVNVSSIAIAGADAGNYNLQNTTAATTANITPKDLTAAYTGVNKVYDATTTAAATGASGDIIAGDTVTFAQNAAFVDKNVGTGKTVNVSSIAIAGADAGNYNLQNTTAATTANITPKDLTAAYTGVNKVYDATTTATATGASGDIIAGDTVTFAQNAAFVDKNVGTGKTVNVSSIAIAGADAGNYNLQNTTAATTANITPKDLTAAYTGVNKVYDATTTAAATGASGDIIAGDTVTFAQSAAFTDKNAGTGKTVNVSSISISGTDAGNYNLQNTTAATTANITPKDLTAAYTGVNKVYDATTTATATGASGDIIAGDTVTFAQNAAFADKNAGTGKTVNVSSIAIAGTDAGNYSLQNTTAATTADIAAKGIAATAIIAEDKVFDGTATAGLDTTDAGLAGVVAGDAVTLDTSSSLGAFENPYVGGKKAVTVTGLTLSGNDAANYTLAGYRTTANITPVATPDNLASPQKATNGTQLDQSGPQSPPGGSVMGPGGGSATMAAAWTSPLVSGAPESGGASVLTSSQFTAPVAFEAAGPTTIMEIGGGTGSGSLVEVGTLPIFNQSGQSTPVAQGSIIVRESASALSVTRGDAAAGVIEPREFGNTDAKAVPFTLATEGGTTVQLAASVSGDGILVIDLPDSSLAVDPSQAVLMGLMIIRKEKAVAGVDALKGVLLRKKPSPLQTSL